MSYDPFSRGPLPVGVRTLEVSGGGRSLPLEVWYPATDAHAGQDLDPASADSYEMMPGLPPMTQSAVRDAEPRQGSFGLIGFSHGFGGHRRQTTHLCTHWASHGYVVVAPDHSGNTAIDLMMMAMQTEPDQAEAAAGDVLETFIELRPVDLSGVLTAALEDDALGLASVVDASRIGVAGHSFGGWTALQVTGKDSRVGAVLALAPAGGSTDMNSQPLQDALDLGWGRDVPALMLVADRDTILPLRGMHEIHEKIASPKRMVVLRDSDHLHFCDNVEMVHEMFRMMPLPGPFGELQKLIPAMTELCSGDSAYTMMRGLGLAHMDATLGGHAEASALLQADLKALLEERGVIVDVH